MNNDINEKIVHAAPVPPFVRFVASAVPMVFDNSLSYYESLCALWKWMQDNLVDVINNNATVTEHYIEMDEETRQLFIELKSYVDNYFDNLDVQEEINNKLDAMAEAGTLQEIITAYIQSNVAWTFDTVTDMKQATNLTNGSYARTLGFYSIDDGGGALYYITDTGTANEMDVIAVGDLYANLCEPVEVTPEMFGAHGDNVNDDTDAIQRSFNYGTVKVTFMPNKTYLVTPYNLTYGIEIPSNRIIDLAGSLVQVIPSSNYAYKVFDIKDCDNVTLKNGYINGDVVGHTGVTGENGHGVFLTHCTNVLLENLHVSDMWGDGINIAWLTPENYESSNITIRNCVCDSNRRQGMSVQAGSNIYVENCKFINTGRKQYTGPGAGVDVEPPLANKTLENIMFVNCIFKNNYGQQFVGGGNASDGTYVKNLILSECILDDNANTSTSYSLWIKDVLDSKVVNCNIGSVRQVVLQPTNDFIFQGNKVGALAFNVRTQSATNAKIVIDNNSFETPAGKKHGVGFINNYDNNPQTNNNNTIVITNNVIKDKTSGEYVVSNIIEIKKQQGFDKAIIKNNYCEGSKNGIVVSCSSIIENNTIVGCTYYGAQIMASEGSDGVNYFVIRNNIFQNTGSTDWVIWNYYNSNLVIEDNLYYPIYFNTGIGTTNYTKTAFLRNTATPSGYSHIANNQILSAS